MRGKVYQILINLLSVPLLRQNKEIFCSNFKKCFFFGPAFLKTNFKRRYLKNKLMNLNRILLFEWCELHYNRLYQLHLQLYDSGHIDRSDINQLVIGESYHATTTNSLIDFDVVVHTTLDKIAT